MRLKDALTIAGSFAGKEPPFDLIHFSENSVAAGDAHTGVQIDVDGISIKMAAPALQVLKAAKAFSEPKVSKGKGQSLVVRGRDSNSRFTIKSRLSRLKPPIEPPSEGWFTFDADTMKAIKAAASPIDLHHPINAVMAGLHLAPNWIGAASLVGSWFVWVGVGSKSVTINPKMFANLSGGCHLAVLDKGLVIRDQSEQTRWSIGYAGEYPAASVEATVQAARDKKGRAVVKLPIKSFTKLCKAATAAMTAPAEVLKLTIDGNALSIHRPQDDSAGFDGQIEVEIMSSGQKSVGVSAAHLAKMAQLCVEEAADYYLSVGEPIQPLSIWGGSKVMVEAVILPAYLP